MNIIAIVPIEVAVYKVVNFLVVKNLDNFEDPEIFFNKDFVFEEVLKEIEIFVNSCLEKVL